MPKSSSQTTACTGRPYKAPFWLPGGHLQTIVGAILPRTPQIQYRRERWELDDGDFVDVDWVDTKPEPSQQKKPILVIFHGLEGSSQSPYAKSLLAAAFTRGWHGAVIHFRGCSGEPNRLPRFYYAGDSDEIDTMLSRIRTMYPDHPVYAVGYSLGGNALLKWLGETGSSSQHKISKAVAVSAPMDLKATAVALDKGPNRFLYTPMFVNSLRRKALHLSARYPGMLDNNRVRRAKTIHDIDNAVTAIVYGAKDATDYYHKNAAKPFLKNIMLPTLIINARNDPFLPAQFLPGADEVSAHVTLDYPEQGGHIGFYSPFISHEKSWLPTRIIEFLALN